MILKACKVLSIGGDSFFKAEAPHISPLFNPFYMSYSSSKGLSYKLKIRLSTDFTNLRDVLVISDKSIAERAALLQAARDSINKISGAR